MLNKQLLAVIDIEPKSKTKSNVWDKFGRLKDSNNKIINGYVTCKLCNEVFSHRTSGGVSALTRHLRRFNSGHVDDTSNEFEKFDSNAISKL